MADGAEILPASASGRYRCTADLQSKKLSDPDPATAYGLVQRVNGRYGEKSPPAGPGQSGTANLSGSRRLRSLMHRTGRDQPRSTDTRMMLLDASLDVALTADHAVALHGCITALHRRRPYAIPRASCQVPGPGRRATSPRRHRRTPD